MSDIGLSAILVCGFVGSIYLWPKERQFVVFCLKDLRNASKDGPHYVYRDSPSTIQRRLTSFVAATGVNILILEYFLRKEPSRWHPLWGSTALRYIFSPENNIAYSMAFAAASSMATLVLFSGPILEGTQQSSEVLNDRLIFFRNLLVAPFGEEIFFRGLLFYVLRTRSTASFIKISSVFFSLSHSHHIFTFAAEECRNADELCGPDTGVFIFWRRAAQRLLGAFACTFAYGILSGYYFTDVCERNILATTLSHLICNFLGAPPLRFLRKGTPRRRITHAIAYGAGIIGWVLIILKLKMATKTRSGF